MGTTYFWLHVMGEGEFEKLPLCSALIKISAKMFLKVYTSKQFSTCDKTAKWNMTLLALYTKCRSVRMFKHPKYQSD